MRHVALRSPTRVRSFSFLGRKVPWLFLLSPVTERERERERERNRTSDNIMAEERTFKAYTSTQAQAYNAGRGSYHERLYELILRAHGSMGSPSGNLVDVGCGPGNSTRPMAKYFDRAWGIDPSDGMIEMARQLSEEIGSETKAGGKIVWEVGREEDVGAGGREGEVDMITAGMAVRRAFLAARLQLFSRWEIV